MLINYTIKDDQTNQGINAAITQLYNSIGTLIATGSTNSFGIGTFASWSAGNYTFKSTHPNYQNYSQIFTHPTDLNITTLNVQMTPNNYCGDGNCSLDENSFSCSQDCS